MVRINRFNNCCVEPSHSLSLSYRATYFPRRLSRAHRRFLGPTATDRAQSVRPVKATRDDRERLTRAARETRESFRCRPATTFRDDGVYLLSHMYREFLGVAHIYTYTHIYTHVLEFDRSKSATPRAPSACILRLSKRLLPAFHLVSHRRRSAPTPRKLAALFGLRDEASVYLSGRERPTELIKIFIGSAARARSHVNTRHRRVDLPRDRSRERERERRGKL